MEIPQFSKISLGGTFGYCGLLHGSALLSWPCLPSFLPTARVLHCIDGSAPSIATKMVHCQVTWRSYSHIHIFMFVFPRDCPLFPILVPSWHPGTATLQCQCIPSWGVHPTCCLHQGGTVSERASVANPHCCVPWFTSLLVSWNSHVSILHVRAQRMSVDLWMIGKWVWIIVPQRAKY